MKRFTFLLLCALLVPLSTLAQVYFVDNDLKYKIIDDDKKLVEVGYNYYKPSGDIIIPPTVTYNDTTYTVIGLYDYAFQYCPKITSAYIPNSVTYIGDWAFGTLDTDPGQLSKIYIGSSVNHMDVNVFQFCNSIEAIYSYALTPPSTNNTFRDNQSNVRTQATLYVPGLALDAYRNGNQEWSGFKNIVAMNIDFVADDIYYKINSDGNTVSVVSNYELSWVYTGAVKIPSSVEVQGKTYTVTGIAANAFKGSTGLTSITIPSTITTIGENAFNGCSALTTVSVEATTPPALAADNCFPDAVYNSAPLYVPRNAQSAYSGSSYAWNKFKKISASAWDMAIDGIYYTINDDGTSVTVTYKYAYMDIYGFEIAYSDYSGHITIPSSIHYNGTNYTVTAIYQLAFNQCAALTGVDIPNTVTSIGSRAFVDAGIIKIVIPDSVTEVGENAFYCANNLTEITLPKNLTHITVNMIYACPKLTKLTIPDGVVTIEHDALGQLGLTEITIPHSVTSIGSYAFYSCPDMTKVVLGRSVAEIGENIFMSCSKITEVYSFNPVPPTANENSFDADVYTNATLYVPRNSKDAYTSSSHAWKKFSKIVELEYDVLHNGIYYLVNDDGKSLSVTYKDSNYNSYSGKMEIPSSVLIGGTAYPVTGIGENAFKNCSELTEVILSNSVKNIGANVFDAAAINKITLPKGVESIDSSAFAYCSTLTEVVVDEANPTYSSSEGVLFNKDKTTLVLYPHGKRGDSEIPGLTTNPISTEAQNIAAYVIPETVLKVNQGAFFNSDNVKIVLVPNSVTTIEKEAFAACDSLDTVMLGTSVATIGEKAFAECPALSAIYSYASTPPTAADNVFDDTTYSKATLHVTKLAKAAYEGSTTCWYKFATKQTLKFDFIADGIYYIIYSDNISVSVSFNGEFGSYTGDVVIPSSVTFNGTTYAVTGIGDYAFAYSSELKSITIPKSVKAIGKSILAGTLSLNEIILESGHEDLAVVDNILFDKELTALLAYPGSKSGDYVIPESVSIIWAGAFGYCPNLTAVTIPNTVDYIGNSAFILCTGLRSITIPDSVTYIAEQTFQYCTGLETLNLGKSVELIDDAAFYACTKLTELRIPDSVEVIESVAFYGCENLTTVILGKGLEFIQHWAFRNCNKIEEVYSHNTTAPLATDDAFSPTTYDNAKLYVPISALSDYVNVGCWRYFLIIPWCYDFVVDGIYYIINTDGVSVSVSHDGYGASYSGDIVIPSSVTFEGTTYTVTGISDYAFVECSGLTSITIPKSVTTIGTSIIGDTPSLNEIILEAEHEHLAVVDNVLFNKEMTTLFACPGSKSGDYVIPETVTTIWAGAFAYCSNLTAVTIPQSVSVIHKYAFGSCYGLTQMTIPDGVTTIGVEAFCDCYNLTKLTIGKSVSEIDSGAFSYCKKLESIYVYSSTPPTADDHVFSDIVYANAKLYVPEEAFDSYIDSDQCWRLFNNRQGLGQSGIDDIVSDEAEAQYYNLQGVPVENPENGIYIRIRGGKSEKVFIK